MPIPYRRVDCSAPGILRRRRGRGFEYLDGDVRIEDPETLSRIRALGIPPAWKDVWICSDPKGHIQAVGMDAAGRKQYIYHEKWRERRDQQKFNKMVEFAERLPKVRMVTNDHLSMEGMPRETGARVCGPSARSRFLQGRRRGLRRVQPVVRSRDDAEEARHPRGRRSDVRLHRQEREATHPVGRRPSGLRGRDRIEATSCRGAGTPRVPRRTQMDGHPLDRHQRLPEGCRGGRVLGQGLPNLARHGPRSAGSSGVVQVPMHPRRRGSAPLRAPYRRSLTTSATLRPYAGSPTSIPESSIASTAA